MAGVMFNVPSGGATLGDVMMRGLQGGYGFAAAIRENERSRKLQEEEDAFKEGLKRSGADALSKLTPDSLMGLDEREAAMRKAEAVADAQAEWAIQHGRLDQFGQHFAASANMREFRRMKAFAAADRAFNLSRTDQGRADFNAYVPALNAINDGKKVLGFLDRGNGMLDVQFEQDGKKKSVRMSADDALRMINADRDPAAARAQELQYRLKKHESDLKRAENREKTDDEIRKERDKQLHEAALRNPQFQTAGPGQVVLRNGVPVFQNVAPDGDGAGGAGGAWLDPGKMLPTYKADVDLAMSLGPQFGGNDPINGPALTPQGQALVEQMARLRANPQLSSAAPQTLAAIVTKGQRGRGKLQDGSEVEVIRYGGQDYVLGQINGVPPAPRPAVAPMSAQQPRPAVAGPGSPMASDARPAVALPSPPVAPGAPGAPGARPAGFPVVTPQQQAERDAGRRRLLEEELANERDPAARAALQRELDATPQVQPATPAEAIAAPPPQAAVDAQRMGTLQRQATAADEAAAKAAPLPDPKEQVGRQVDAARKTLQAALSRRNAYGLKQRRDDPEGFAQAERAVAVARAALKEAESAWVEALGPGAGQVFARPGAAKVIAGR